jgi:Secretion system C-terminal sorting domain/Peptidase_C39 like family
MRKLIKIVLFFAFFNTAFSQNLSVPQVFQEQNEWCWAGVSKAVLDYYGFPLNQCQIADYARQSITWYNFGSTDCCLNPNLGCNYWNYNWGSAGSIQDILIHFGNIQNSGTGTALTLAQIGTQITNGRPFIVRWGWTTGGGHFVVGSGINGTNISYMNPWPGEGLHIGTYSWLVSGSNHTWTHTNIISTNLNVDELVFDDSKIKIFPIPASSFVNIDSNEKISNFKIYNLIGQLVKNEKSDENNLKIDVSSLQSGTYILEFEIQNKPFYKKLIKE